MKSAKIKYNKLNTFIPPGGTCLRWRDYVSRLAWKGLGVPLEELEEVTGAMKASLGVPAEGCCPRDPTRDKCQKMR